MEKVDLKNFISIYNLELSEVKEALKDWRNKKNPKKLDEEDIKILADLFSLDLSVLEKALKEKQEKGEEKEPYQKEPPAKKETKTQKPKEQTKPVEIPKTIKSTLLEPEKTKEEKQIKEKELKEKLKEEYKEEHKTKVEEKTQVKIEPRTESEPKEELKAKEEKIEEKVKEEIKKQVDQEVQKNITEKVQKPAEEIKEVKQKEEKEPQKQKEKKQEKQSKEQKPQKQEKKEEELKMVEIPELINVRELAELLNLSPNTIIAELFKSGILVTINQNIDPKLAVSIAERFGYLAEIKSYEEALEENEKEEEDRPEDLKPRPPVVVVMGHVDHGKTTLLDAIRQTNVAAKEKGGITQHIGASMITTKDKRQITFLDTPGHEAFTSLRARGAKVTDIAVLVVAADDGVMPQTIEAINHAKSFNVPIIVAVNKIDKPGADPSRVRRELSELGLIPEEWGGDTIFVDVSAKTKQNIDTLLEMILLMADILELKANPNKKAKGIILESRLDKKMGPVGSVLIEEGTLRVGDIFVSGSVYGRVRAMINDKGQRVKEALPSMAVEVIGFEEVPEAGDTLKVVDSEKEAKQIAELRKAKKQEESNLSFGIALEDVFKKIEEGQLKELRLIIKADAIGSLEAIKKSLEDIKNDKVVIKVIHGQVGAITESDVMLAKASNAIIIGFNVRPDIKVKEKAAQEKVDIKLYGIIYELIDDIKKAISGMLEPVKKENFLGTAEVRATFKVKGAGTVAGCYVLEGKIVRNAKARLLRDGIVIYDGKIESLKRFKEDVQEVAKGYECGIKLQDYNDIKVGDKIEAYEIVLEKQSI